jgi:3-deoxy-D-manno-octulosonic acid hydroxylase-like protein
MSVLETLDVASWSGPFTTDLQATACAALERGQVLFFPHLPFAFRADEQDLLSPALSDGKAKNISLDPTANALKGTNTTGDVNHRLHGMMERFGQSATRLVKDLLPRYASGLERARTSFRPVEIVGRHYSPIKDDRLLHVDAFPSQPMRGRRILRLFSNIAPDGDTRVWRVGEPFDAFAKKFAGRLPRPNPAAAWLLAALGITKGRRSAYDQLMLNLHDAGKLDRAHQESGVREEVAFPAGTTWLCFTDQVLHAALAGRFALEQTFHIDVAAMAEPDRSPLRVLERLRGEALV